jgi:hypothetical protein
MLRESGHPVRRAVSIHHNCSGILDHPLEPVIGRRLAPTRWPVMTVGIEIKL